ncbi:hypothetical protein HZH66_006818 [Vespula vulgaris]|uniref:Uncharacterized protein n=1 Tax=Vespula vulgaris TaxID=7454 RepID=A0A834K4A3_VESVU|nr:hypothetical protein HZH66_006818 [Vespula vulgaris]
MMNLFPWESTDYNECSVRTAFRAAARHHKLRVRLPVIRLADAEIDAPTEIMGRTTTDNGFDRRNDIDWPRFLWVPFP